MLATEWIQNGFRFIELEKQILEKTGQKQNPYRTSHVVVDKSQVQAIRLFRGLSCGFSFECLNTPVWICRGDNCKVEVTARQDFVLKDHHHYNK